MINDKSIATIMNKTIIGSQIDPETLKWVLERIFPPIRYQINTIMRITIKMVTIIMRVTSG